MLFVSLGLPLGLEAPVMTPKGVILLFFPFYVVCTCMFVVHICVQQLVSMVYHVVHICLYCLYVICLNIWL